MTVHSRLKYAIADLHVEVEFTLGLDKITEDMAAYSEIFGILYLVFDHDYKELTVIDFHPFVIDLKSVGCRRDWLAAQSEVLDLSSAD